MSARRSLIRQNYRQVSLGYWKVRKRIYALLTERSETVRSRSDEKRYLRGREWDDVDLSNDGTKRCQHFNTSSPHLSGNISRTSNTLNTDLETPTAVKVKRGVFQQLNTRRAH